MTSQVKQPPSWTTWSFLNSISHHSSSPPATSSTSSTSRQHDSDTLPQGCQAFGVTSEHQSVYK
eukprot:272759-Amphidinium_carterae.1